MVDNKRYILGCSGYFYKGWWGKFYPKDIKMSEWFSYYASIFNTVEINSTFYRMPKPSDVKRWYRNAPEGFIFSVKMPRTITHYKKFRDVKEEIRDFYSLMKDNLKEKLGCVLIQLPPSYKKSEDNLGYILDSLDYEIKNVVEFRHKSWWSEDVYEELKSKNVSFCSVSAPKLPEDLVITADFVYVRFHGKDKWYRYNYSEDELKEWAYKLKNANFKEAFVYFNNDIDANAPKNCIYLRNLLLGT